MKNIVIAEKNKKKKEASTLSIRNSILLVSLVLMLITACSIGLLIFTNWMNSANEMAVTMSEDLNHEVITTIDSVLHVPYHICEVNEPLLEYEIIDMTEKEKREQFFVSVLLEHESDIYSFSFGTVDGEYYGARRNAENDIEIMINNAMTDGISWYYSLNDDLTAGTLAVKAGAFDPRTRDWYKRAVEYGTIVYSSIYKHFYMNDLTISTSCPVYNLDGELLGVLGAHMLLNDVDQELNEAAAKIGGYAMIFETQTEEMIGNSFGETDYTILDDGTFSRLSLLDIKNEMMKQAYLEYTGDSMYQFTFEKEHYFVSTEHYVKDGLDWMVVSVLPEDITMEDLDNNITYTWFMVLILVLLFTVIIYWVITYLFRPVNQLIIAMNTISSGDLSRRVTITRKDEIGQISEMFNEMTDKMSDFVNNLESKVSKRTIELQNTNENLVRTKDELRLILDSTAEGIFGVDTNGICTFCNNRAVTILGYQRQEDLKGKDIHNLLHYKKRDNTPLGKDKCMLLRVFATGEPCHSADDVFWKADETCFDVEFYSYPQRKGDVLIGAVVTFTDITERKQSEERIEYLHNHDALTGLLNRRSIEAEIIKCDRESLYPVSILYADLNGLKLVNDVFGHAAGDELIRIAAQILQESCTEHKLIGRIGGDEFVILLPETKKEDAIVIMEQIRKRISEEKVNDISCSMALGLDTKLFESQNIEKIMGNAEYEMYKDKALTKKNFGKETITSIIRTLHRKLEGEQKHSYHVAVLCKAMGQHLELTETEIQKLFNAGYLHDIGKITLDDTILRVREPKDEKELQMKMQHTAAGYRILNLFDGTLDLAEAAYAHHEKWDGTGFPKGLSKNEIPLQARIIAIAEAFDRKIPDQQWEDDETRNRVLEELNQESGKAFDPTLLRMFSGMIRNHEDVPVLNDTGDGIYYA